MSLRLQAVHTAKKPVGSGSCGQCCWVGLTHRKQFWGIAPKEPPGEGPAVGTRHALPFGHLQSSSAKGVRPCILASKTLMHTRVNSPLQDSPSTAETGHSEARKHRRGGGSSSQAQGQHTPLGQALRIIGSKTEGTKTSHRSRGELWFHEEYMLLLRSVQPWWQPWKTFLLIQVSSLAFGKCC